MKRKASGDMRVYSTDFFSRRQDTHLGLAVDNLTETQGQSPQFPTSSLQFLFQTLPEVGAEHVVGRRKVPDVLLH